MNHQVLFSLKDKCKKIKCRLLQLLFGALRVKQLRISIIRFIDIHKYSIILDIHHSIFWLT